jgi:hypothetical protein
MRRRQTPTVALAAISLAAAGSTDTCRASLSEPGTPQLEFTVAGVTPDDETPMLRVDSISAGQVVLRGRIGTPTPCYTIGAELAQRDATLSVSLVATANEGVCIQMVGAFGYRARIHGLGAGSYTVEVVATYPGTGWTPRADTLQVDIP